MSDPPWNRGAHAVYPGSFDPFTEGHADVVARVRCLFDRVTVLVAVNGEKQPAVTIEQRSADLRRSLPADWDDVTVVAWSGLTAEFCRRYRAGVIVRGVRNTTDLQQESRLAAMNEGLGIATLLIPARPGLAVVSSTAVRARHA
ncbi:pantetheine-phosphate adenylyltransferase [Actinoplanes sp. NPDC051851]|uniref:pantetheine-phosphate adenylyltransferase n=1 Tax=Actinoplanes sp. NPDC051851 TaxID=3154753 RepID=UPI003414FC17